MDDQERLDLMQLVESERHHIIQFLLLAHNIRVKEGEVSLFYSEGEGEPYLNLWELEVEPHLVRVEFVIERPKEEHWDIRGILDLLIDKITTRGWPDSANDSVAYTKSIVNEYNQYQSIKIVEERDDLKIILIGAIGYFS